MDGSPLEWGTDWPNAKELGAVETHLCKARMAWIEGHLMTAQLKTLVTERLAHGAIQRRHF